MKSPVPYRVFDRYILRTPTLPLAFYKDLVQAGGTEAKIKEALEVPLIAEALYLASPVLHQQALIWKAGRISDPKKVRRIKNSLLKYLIRMSTRCTPFGLFAGCSVGQWGTDTQLCQDENEPLKRHTRYDMHFVVVLAQHLAKKEHIREQLKYFPNTTLYRFGDRYRYVEYRYEDKKRVHSIESVRHSTYLEQILERASKGCPIAALINLLTAEDVTEDEAKAFIHELIDNQLLVSELEPQVTGMDYFEYLRHKVSTLVNCEQEHELLNALSRHLEFLNAKDTMEISTYKVALNYISSLNIEFEPRFLFQTDAYNAFKINTLDKSIVRKVKMGLRLIQHYDSKQRTPMLEQFKQDFQKRYDQQLKSLLHVLDIESGIGYGDVQVAATPFLDDIEFPTQGNMETIRQPLTAAQLALRRKLHDALVAGKRSIQLSDSDLGETRWENQKLPNSLAVLMEIVWSDGSEKIYLEAVAPYAARLLARFASGEPNINNLVQEIADSEKALNPDKILAEIVHIPESRTGNVLRRPVVREYEIPCLSRSAVSTDYQLALQDLLVGVENDEIVVYSKRLKKRIEPRLSNAHNYRRNPLPVYQFLCDLQHQGQDTYSFNWGMQEDEYRYVPRVEYRDVILSKEQWIIQNDALFELVKSNKTKGDEALYHLLSAWRAELGIPDTVELIAGDNTLLVDFLNPETTRMFYDEIKNKKYTFLQEVFLSEPDAGNKRNGAFRNQFVVVLHHQNPTVDQGE